MQKGFTPLSEIHRRNLLYERLRRLKEHYLSDLVYKHLLTGFTLLELIVVMGIIAILFGFIMINIAGIQRKVSSDTAAREFISDFKNQQMKAMEGITAGAAVPSDYGIYIDTNRYILFKGSAYDPLGTSNFVINLDSNMQISPNQTILFSRKSGEIAGFDTGFKPNIIFKNTTIGTTLTVTINRHGVITAVN